MDGYKVWFDSKLKAFRNDNDASPIGNEPKDSTTMWFAKLETAEGAVDSFNRGLATCELIVKTCKECRKTFILSQEELKWYEDRSLTAPERCYGCRMKRRKGKEAKSNGRNNRKGN